MKPTFRLLFQAKGFFEQMKGKEVSGWQENQTRTASTNIWATSQTTKPHIKTFEKVIIAEVKTQGFAVLSLFKSCIPTKRKNAHNAKFRPENHNSFSLISIIGQGTTFLYIVRLILIYKILTKDGKAYCLFQIFVPFNTGNARPPSQVYSIQTYNFWCRAMTKNIWSFRQLIMKCIFLFKHNINEDCLFLFVNWIAISWHDKVDPLF